jgi:DNA mismatch repair protein MutS
MKAIGLNIILAQAGFFVSATSFKYSPYTQIFTRILNNDNIFRSQSSFAVEVQELKSIMNRADQNSLILGDELCSGTESISALSIITAGLHRLCSRKCTFIFTSHLHQLTTLEEIQSLQNLKIYHLKIQYDKEKNELIYDRKLAEGSGPSIYGLQVCEAMGMDSEFISYAKTIQNKLEKDDLLSSKQSQYNSDIFMSECQICSKKGDLETHHIKDQQFADDNHMIDHHHMNIQHNLVPLCKECHLQVTNHKLIVTGWKQTFNGRKLEWHKNESQTIKTKKKFSEDQQIIIRDLREQMKGCSLATLMKNLEVTNNIKISYGVLNKILNNTY